MALDFYQLVTGKSVLDGPLDNVTLTGHSLGGGLAGFVSALSGTKGVGFDHMPFGLAAELQYAAWLWNNNPRAHEPDYSKFNGVYVTGEVNQPLRAGEYQLGAGLAAAIAAFFAAGPGAVIPAALLNVLGLSEAAATVLLETEVNKQALDSFGGLRDPMKLHSQALLVTLQYASDMKLTNWSSISPSLIDALMSDGVGKAAGFSPRSDKETSTAGSKMLTAIAYSALDGEISDLTYGYVFGNSAIRSLFNDAEALGTLKLSGKMSAALNDSMGGVTEAVVQFAGLMAQRKVNYHDYRLLGPSM